MNEVSRCMRRGRREEVRGRGGQADRVAALNDLCQRQDVKKIPNINKLCLSGFHNKRSLHQSNTPPLTLKIRKACLQPLLIDRLAYESRDHTVPTDSLRSYTLEVFVVEVTTVFVTSNTIDYKAASASLQTKITPTTYFVNLRRTKANRLQIVTN